MSEELVIDVNGLTKSFGGFHALRGIDLDDEQRLMSCDAEPPPLPDNVDVRIPPVEGSKFEPKFPDGKKATEKAADKPTEIAAITEPTGVQAAQGMPSAVPPPLAAPANGSAAFPQLSSIPPAPTPPSRARRFPPHRCPSRSSAPVVWPLRRSLSTVART